MKKKLLSAVLSVAMIATVLAGCGGSGDDEGGSGSKTAKVIDIDLTEEEYDMLLEGGENVEYGFWLWEWFR